MIAANILFFIAIVNINGITRLFCLSGIEQIYHTRYTWRQLLWWRNYILTTTVAEKKESSEDDQSDQNEWILLFLHNSTTEKTFCWNICSRLSHLRISDLYPFVQSEDFIHQFHFWLFFLGLENWSCVWLQFIFTIMMRRKW